MEILRLIAGEWGRGVREPARYDWPQSWSERSVSTTGLPDLIGVAFTLVFAFFVDILILPSRALRLQFSSVFLAPA